MDAMAEIAGDTVDGERVILVRLIDVGIEDAVAGE